MRVVTYTTSAASFCCAFCCACTSTHSKRGISCREEEIGGKRGGNWFCGGFEVKGRRTYQQVGILELAPFMLALRGFER